MRGTPPIDLEALFVALVLAPSTFSRNRFYSLYADPEARRVRRRAALLRSIVRQLVGGAGHLRCAVARAEAHRRARRPRARRAPHRGRVPRAVQQDGGGAAPSPAAGAALPDDLLPEPADSSRIERALARLLPREGQGGALEAPGEGEPDPATRALPRDRERRDTQAP
ncbi:hypothetical protein BE20_09455 [Sorangium cellulosum]|nr:hypothetical protein BE20_09455 [Sorangium cellulosum]